MKNKPPFSTFHSTYEHDNYQGGASQLRHIFGGESVHCYCVFDIDLALQYVCVCMGVHACHF